MLTFLSLPPVSAWPVAFLAVVPLIYAGCRGAHRPVFSALIAGLGTLPLWFYESVWLVNVTVEGYPGLSIYLALFPAIFVWLIAVSRRVDWPVPMSVVAPVAWLMVEVFRGEIGLTGYAWYLLAHPLIAGDLLAAPASIISVYGVSFLCAALAGAVADAAGWTGLHRPVGGLGAVAVVILWTTLSIAGLHRDSASGARTRAFSVGVVQTNIPQSNKMGWSTPDKLRDFERFGEMSKFAAAGPSGPSSADLIVWPETMFPGRTLNASAVQVERDIQLSYGVKDAETLKKFPTGRVPSVHFADEIVKLQQELGVPMLVGALAVEGEYERWLQQALSRENSAPDPGLIRRYNSAFVIRDGKVQQQRYDKIELTPFGEVIPYVWRFPALQQAVLSFGAAGMSFDLAPGTYAAGLDIRLGQGAADASKPDPGQPVVRVATPICFEVTKSGLCRDLIRGDGSGRSSLIVNLSNDGWFGDFDPGRAQHLLAARWRCVELGVPMVRAVNTGLSAAIDARGQIITSQLVDRPIGKPRVDGVMIATVNLWPDRSATIFEHIGLSPAYGVSIVGLAGTIVFVIRRRKIVREGA